MYAAAAHFRVDESADGSAKRRLFVIRATGGSASITNAEDFTPERPAGRARCRRVRTVCGSPECPEQDSSLVDEAGRSYLSRAGNAENESQADRTVRSRYAARGGPSSGSSGSVGSGRRRRCTLLTEVERGNSTAQLGKVLAVL